MNKNLISLLAGISLFTGCSVKPDTNIFNHPKKEKSIEEKILISSKGLLQNSYLLYHDIFTYTKPLIENGIGTEANPIWAPLNNNCLFGLSYSIQVGTLLLGNILSYKIDSSGNLANILNGALSLAEILTIAHNDKLVPRNLNFNTEIFTLHF